MLYSRSLLVIYYIYSSVENCFFVVIGQSPSHLPLFATPWTAACQASLSLTISQNLPKFIFIALVMLSSHLVLWHPLLFLPSGFPNIRGFSNESSVHIRCLKYWSFSFSISPSSEYSGLLPLRLTGLISLLFKGLSGVFSSTTWLSWELNWLRIVSLDTHKWD